MGNQSIFHLLLTPSLTVCYPHTLSTHTHTAALPHAISLHQTLQQRLRVFAVFFGDVYVVFAPLSSVILGSHVPPG